MAAAFEDILYEIDGHIATITINRPEKLNSCTPDTMREIETALDMAGKDPVVGVIVFTGAGEKSFCAGADVSKQREGKMGHTGPREFAPPYLTFSQCPKPIIARVNGYAVGGGNHFAYFCDFTIAADHAIFSQSEPRVAYPTSGPVISYLVRVVGHKRAREMWMLGRKYSAQQMYDWGLVNAVVPMADLDAEVAKWCDELLAVAPTCLKVYKATFVQEFQDLLGQGDSLRRWIVPDNYRDTEQKEGTTAFLEKRKPDFSRFRAAPEQKD
ncbi:enoyl-CoA hydratase-related protein [Salipiger abyssi]|uniref:2-ketocyclohexanecarboxyl-CoA hydrolase n=1 Tax=Salipiger abyssi TaxID=1250539 RepID=A0A1P8V0P6_9RHOB|nr:enoyl-CoA hydratase-related protein [Salipiger abyssi]APZ55223.1 2-ketocyclohexanecarboxyl-CoA hydrolase [Salipiger abyssi]